jgi:hypothetical protein
MQSWSGIEYISYVTRKVPDFFNKSIVSLVVARTPDLCGVEHLAMNTLV